jgi:ribosomal protein S26
MCGALNEILETTAVGEDVGKICIRCGKAIESFEAIHRSSDGEIVRQACFNDLNDEDAHFYEELPTIYVFRFHSCRTQRDVAAINKLQTVATTLN